MAIKAKEEALMKAMEPIAQEMYAHAQGAQGAAGAQPGAEAPHAEPPKGDAGGKKDDVIDADFTMNN